MIVVRAQNNVFDCIAGRRQAAEHVAVRFLYLFHRRREFHRHFRQHEAGVGVRIFLVEIGLEQLQILAGAGEERFHHVAAD